MLVDYRREQVIDAVLQGPTPRIAANVRLFWPSGPGRPDQYGYDDLVSRPHLRVTAKRLVSYRMVRLRRPALVRGGSRPPRASDERAARRAVRPDRRGPRRGEPQRGAAGGARWCAGVPASGGIDKYRDGHRLERRARGAGCAGGSPATSSRSRPGSRSRSRSASSRCRPGRDMKSRAVRRRAGRRSLLKNPWIKGPNRQAGCHFPSWGAPPQTPWVADVTLPTPRRRLLPRCRSTSGTRRGCAGRRR